MNQALEVRLDPHWHARRIDRLRASRVESSLAI
jgi:hypothetical protein